ncbi:hypothetical protein KUW17_08530 [Leisingera aquaemixtae]|uniref:hypothetical protein n=1 Tax=Leisingera aquaemixtae TaxID=1396826 RepID=UPI001C944BB8|nr:hypothetical protein [Leisingera aquaemixtae]MBY6066783.1 hypothetical protein [Leisingera aquaemixtae]
MSKADFQSRLQRINAAPPLRQPADLSIPQTEQARVQKTNYGLLTLGGAVVLLGVQAIKYTNANYIPIEDSIGTAASIGLCFAAYVVFLAGIVAVARAIIKRRIAQPVLQSTKRARAFTSLSGFILGTIACLIMFMSAAARFIETEAAELFSLGSSLIAFLLFLLSALLGLIGLFFRGYTLHRYALWRFPVYFLYGGVLTYAAVRVAGINLLKWPSFIAMLQ